MVFNWIRRAGCGTAFRLVIEPEPAKTAPVLLNIRIIQDSRVESRIQGPEADPQTTPHRIRILLKILSTLIKFDPTVSS